MIEINLLGKNYKGKKSGQQSLELEKIKFVSFIAIIVIEIAALLFYSIFMNGRIDNLTKQKRELNGVKREVLILNSKIKQIKLMTKTIANLDNNRDLDAYILKNVANAIPNGLWLTNLNKKGKIINISGSSFITESIAQYMTNLGSTKLIQKVWFSNRGLYKSKTGGKEIYSFYITAKLK